MNSWRLIALLLAVAVFDVRAQTPEWLWHRTTADQPAPGEIAFFRKTINIPFPPKDARLLASGDDEIIILINGKEAARSDDWRRPVRSEPLSLLKEGKNVLAIKGRNGASGPAGIVLKLEVRSPNNYGLFFVTDKSWLTSSTESAGWESESFDDKSWKAVVSLGAVPVQPWGDVFGEPTATPASKLSVLPGFTAELLRSARPDEGSWICMAFDDKGRIIVSPEKTERPLLRIELDSTGQVKQTLPIPSPMRAAMGLCYAHGSLYVNGHGPKGVGLYRLTDTNGNDQFDPGEERLLKNFEGDSEHGYHAVLKGPDDLIYVLNGNMTKIPPGMGDHSPLRNFQEDLLLPRMWDPTGHAKGIMAPGGHVMRTDPDGKEWTLFCGGFRNAYDFDFNPEGELFTFDSDMEYDVGLPWYRATRILHCVSAADFGWRSGSGKWPDFYADSLPAVVDIGLSSPTATRFGTRSNFPEKYRRAFYAADWNYGRILAVHLQENGSSYSGTFELFLSGKPLPVVAMDFGPDGAMYFITGGWRTQSGLYRVSYTGEKTSAPLLPSKQNAQRELRHKLEKFHGRRDSSAVDSLWPYLRSPDRFLRHAARVGLESQDPALWVARAMDEQDVTASLAALVALARCGGPHTQPDLLVALDRTAESCTTEAQQLDALRILQLSLIRIGRPDDSTCERISERLLQLFPTQSAHLNQEICAVLIFLQDPRIITLALKRITEAPTQQEQVYHAFALRNMRTGWSDSQLRSWFEWCDKALREYRGGVSFATYLQNARRELLERLPEPQRVVMSAIVTKPTPPIEPAKVREFVQEWKMDDLTAALGDMDKARKPSIGREAYVTQCAPCHRFENEGGAVGPDLTSVASRFSRRELLEHILSPSLVISDRFLSVNITRLDGEEISGMIVQEDSDKIIMQCNPAAPMTVEIRHGDIQSRSVSKVSIMPEGLLNQLTKDEILDLLAFIETGPPSDSQLK